ncbi:hypothetical protein BS50DRAFT_574977 [Corynespora cassiicola Philippines]|uniref:Uncharacterized protein n=1 Tax=Corynespora cassiicola Philippines TaxID=1448308 RepID=A0A2T2NHA3_CORCC|nr:hypothetical protein BS50DRAFT_574977 [Corynespora cassiicola Philippines]
MPLGTIKDGKARQQRDDDDGGGSGSDGKVGKGKDKEKTGTFDTKTKVAQIPVTFGTVMGTDIFRMEQVHRRNASTGSTRAAPPANQQENSLRKMPSKIFQAFFKSNTSSNAASVENSGGKSARSSTDKDSVAMLHAGHESIVPELPSASAIQNSASSYRHRRPFIGRGRASSDASFGCKGVSSGMPLMPPQRLGGQGVAQQQQQQQQQQTLQQLQPQQYQQPRARLPRTYTSSSNSGGRKPVPESATTGASTDRSNGESSPRSPAKPVFVDVPSTTPSSTTPTSTKKEPRSGSAANPLFADTPATMPTSGISTNSTPTRIPAMPSPPQRAAPSIPTSNPTPAVACLTRYNDFDSDSELESGVELMPPPLFSGERGGYGEVARVRVKREKERERWWDVRDRNTRFYAQICDIFDQYIELTPSDVEGGYDNRKGGWEGGDDDDDDDDDDEMSYDFKKLEREE